MTNCKLNHIFLTKSFDKDLAKIDFELFKNDFINSSKIELLEKIKKISELKLNINNNFWREFRKDLIIITGNPIGNVIPGSIDEKSKKSKSEYKFYNSFSDKLMQDVETKSIGEFCLASLYTPGISDDQYSYVVTHVNETSTKIPFLFPGEVLSIGSCGFPYVINTENSKKLYDSLKILSSLPNDTLIYPNNNNTLENLEICLKIDSENEFVKEKFKWAQDSLKKNENAVGSRLIEEKFINPVFRLDDSLYSKILGEGLNHYKKFENFLRLKELIFNKIKTNQNDNDKQKIEK